MPWSEIAQKKKKNQKLQVLISVTNRKFAPAEKKKVIRYLYFLLDLSQLLLQNGRKTPSRRVKFFNKSSISYLSDRWIQEHKYESS